MGCPGRYNAYKATVKLKLEFCAPVGVPEGPRRVPPNVSRRGAWRLSSSNQVTSWARTVSASELGAEDIVAFERVHEGLGEPIALGAISRDGDRHEAERMRVERGSRRRVLGVVITEPLGRVRGDDGGLPEARPERSIHQGADGRPRQRPRRATQAGTSRSWQSSANATETTSPLQHGIKLSEHHPLVRRRDLHLA